MKPEYQHNQTGPLQYTADTVETTTTEMYASRNPGPVTNATKYSQLTDKGRRSDINPSCVSQMSNINNDIKTPKMHSSRVQLNLKPVINEPQHHRVKVINKSQSSSTHLAEDSSPVSSNTLQSDTSLNTNQKAKQQSKPNKKGKYNDMNPFSFTQDGKHSDNNVATNYYNKQPKSNPWHVQPNPVENKVEQLINESELIKDHRSSIDDSDSAEEGVADRKHHLSKFSTSLTSLKSNISDTSSKILAQGKGIWSKIRN